jgi:hypothetical protein
MDRRKFLSKVPAASAGLVGIASAGSTRLYGLPASLAAVSPVASPPSALDANISEILPSLFRLHVSIDGQPDAFSAQRLAACRAALAVLGDQAQAARFVADPAAFMSAAGIEGATLDTSSLEFGLIAALADPAVRTAANSGDPVAFTNAVMAAGNSGNQPNPDYMPVPPVTFINTVAVLNAYVHMDAVVTTGIVAVSVAIAAVLAVVTLGVAIAGAISTGPSAEVQLAAALGGQKFAEDVAAVQATAAMQGVIASVKDGRLNLPDGLSKEEVIAALSSSLKRHMITA